LEGSTNNKFLARRAWGEFEDLLKRIVMLSSNILGFRQFLQKCPSIREGDVSFKIGIHSLREGILGTVSQNYSSLCPTQLLVTLEMGNKMEIKP